jgi:hypothetical protein
LRKIILRIGDFCNCGAYDESAIMGHDIHLERQHASHEWQVDNETSSYGAHNDDVFIGFQHYLEKKFGTPENLSKAWFLNYWGQNIHTWCVQ